MKKQSLEIQEVAIELLQLSDYNPRILNNKQEIDLTESINQFGLIDPIIVNAHPQRLNIIIGGHQRFKIAKKLGYKSVPVIYLSLDREKERNLNLRLNKNTGEWDFELLKNFETEFLLDVGFTDVELGDIWDDVLSIEDDDFNEKEELEKITETNIKSGQIYKLGQHRLICGDSLSPAIIKKLMGDDLANIIYADPPFNIGLDYNKGMGGKQNYGGTINDKKTTHQYQLFLKTILINALAHCKKDLHIFSYCDQKYIWLLQQLFAELGIKNQRVCLWIKNGLNLTPQIAFNKSYEPVIYGTVGKPYLSSTKNLTEIINQEVGSGNRAIEDVLDMLDVWLEKRLAGQEYQHPTSKPPTLHEKPLRRCSKINDIIIDPFTGSGSTLIACEQLKRRAYLCEIEPIFCQLIINRFEQLTDSRAELIK